MTNTLNLGLEALDTLEAPLTDMEWGLLAGGAFAGGVVAVIVIFT